MEFKNSPSRRRFVPRSRRTMLLLGVTAILVLGAVSGTIAWLTDTTVPLTNTFTSSDIDITLTETSTSREFQMVPGVAISKDPKVTVMQGSERCWLFVKVDESTNFDDFMTYSIMTEWTKLTGAGVTGEIYYRVVDENAADQVFSILTGDQVTVQSTVTKSDMTTLSVANYPTLTFTAYALQYESFSTALAAWTQLNPSP